MGTAVHSVMIDVFLETAREWILLVVSGDHLRAAARETSVGSGTRTERMMIVKIFTYIIIKYIHNI